MRINGEGVLSHQYRSGLRLIHWPLFLAVQKPAVSLERQASGGGIWRLHAATLTLLTRDHTLSIILCVSSRQTCGTAAVIECKQSLLQDSARLENRTETRRLEDARTPPLISI